MGPDAASLYTPNQRIVCTTLASSGVGLGASHINGMTAVIVLCRIALQLTQEGRPQGDEPDDQPADD